MAYCRNCRAQLKTAQVCPVCGTQRIPTKKGLLRRKQIPLPDVKNGAEALRAGLREGSTLLLLIAGVALVSSVLALVVDIPLLLQGDLRVILPILLSLTSFLLPIGLFFLRQEKDKANAFSPTGFRLIVEHEICGAVYIVGLCLYVLLLPFGGDDLGLLGGLVDALLSGFFDLVVLWLFIVLIVCAAFGLGVLWTVAGIRLCKNALRLATENKRFRIPKYFEIGILLAGGLSILSAFSDGKELLPALSSLIAAAGYLLKYALLVKVKKHI